MILAIMIATSFSVIAPSISSATSPVSGYIPVTLTNSQSTATPTNFQQLLKIDWSSYSSYLNANVSNVRFFNSTSFSSSNELSGWIETNNTTSATSSNVWVNLSGTIIPASGSTTIYMAFLPTTASWSSHWGLAPQLSTKYGQFDNGADVFTLYFNGNTPTSDFAVESSATLTSTTDTGPTGATINVIKYSESVDNNIGITFQKGIPQGNYIGETSFASGGGSDDIGVIGLGTASTPTTSQSMFSADTQFSGEYLSWSYDDAGSEHGGAIGGTSTTVWHYEWFSYTPGASESDIYAAPQLYSTAGGYSGTVDNYIPSSTTTLYMTIAQNGASFLYYNWLRIRETPPAGVMPATSFGGEISTNGYHITFFQSTLPTNTKWGIRLNDVFRIPIRT